MRYILCLTASRRKTAISLIAACIGWIYYCVNEVKVTISANQHVAVDSVKYIMLAISVVCTFVLRAEA